MSGLPTLSQFIDNARKRSFPSNGYLKEPHWDGLYVRYSKRIILGRWYTPILDLANLTVEERMRGKGVFTKLVTHLRDQYPWLHLYVEQVHNVRFIGHLMKMGFVRAHNHEPSFFLEARLCLVCKKRFVQSGWKLCCGDGDCVGSLSNRGFPAEEI